MSPKIDPFIEKVGNLNEIRHIAAEESTPYGQIIELLHQKRLPSVTLTSGDAVTGIFTERDILNKCLLENIDDKTPISELMTRNPMTIQTSSTIGCAIEIMHDRRIRNLPLLDESGKLVGLLTVGRLIRFLANHHPAEVVNLPPRPSQVTEQVEGA